MDIIIDQMQINRCSGQRILRRHLSDQLILIPQTKTPQKQERKQLLVTSKLLAQKRKMGVSLDRKVRISMEKLYDQTAFREHKHQKYQDSTRYTNSTSRNTKASSPKIQLSKHRISFLEGSEYADQTSRTNITDCSRPESRQMEIYHTYYLPQQTSKPVQFHKPQPFFVNSPKGFSKKYDIGRIIKY